MTAVKLLIKILPFEDAENLDVPDTVVISIVSPGIKHPVMNVKRRLDLSFADVDEAYYHSSGVILPINESQAELVVDFLLRNLDERKWIIHCEAGISRSPAVGLALAELLNENEAASEIRTLYPNYNRFVYSLVMKTYWKKRGEEWPCVVSKSR